MSENTEALARLDRAGSAFRVLDAAFAAARNDWAETLLLPSVTAANPAAHTIMRRWQTSQELVGLALHALREAMGDAGLRVAAFEDEAVVELRRQVRLVPTGAEPSTDKAEEAGRNDRS